MAEVASAGAGATGDGRQGVERVFLIADVRGYTRFTREHGDAEAARLAGRFAELARDAVEARSGRVVELRGDEVLAVFDSAAQAVRAARELAAVCADEAAADGGLPLLVGAGIDVGEAVPLEGGFRGAALNTAARLCSQADRRAGAGDDGAGRASRRGARHPVRKSGSLELKGFDEPVEIVEAVDDAPASRIARPDPRTGGRSRSNWSPIRPSSAVSTSSPGCAARGARSHVATAGCSSSQAPPGSARAASPPSLPRSPAGGRSGLLCRSGRHGGRPAGSRASSRARRARPALLVLDDLDATATTLAPILADAIPEIEGRPVLVLCLLRDPELGPDVERLLRAVDVRGDGHRGLGPLDADGVRGIAALYAADDVDSVPLESIARASEGVPARVHELMSEWAQQEAARRLTAAAEFLAAERRHRRADLAFANNVIGLKLGRIYAVEATTVDLGPGEAPYKGLAAFEESDAALFFGREQLVGELAARTVGAGLLAVVGASGSGKSSVIAAGLLPVAPRRTASRKRALDDVVDPSRRASGRRALDASTRAATSGSCWSSTSSRRCSRSARTRSERAAFVDRLAGLAADPDRYVVVVGLRGDFYGHCAAYPELAAPRLAANQVLVGPMSADELRRAIELPGTASRRARRVGADRRAGGGDRRRARRPAAALDRARRALAGARRRLAASRRPTSRLGGVRRRRRAPRGELVREPADEAARRRAARSSCGWSRPATRARSRDDESPLSELDLDRDPALTAVVDRLTPTGS